MNVLGGLKFTGNIPEDEIAIKVAELYIDIHKKSETELKQGIQEIKEIEKKKEYEGNFFDQNSISQCGFLFKN
jgi:hypothetical protein